MAFSDYTQSPKVVIETGRTVEYATLTDFYATFMLDNVQHIFRLVQKDSTYTERYQFRGLTQAAAIACAEAEKEKHTKDKSIPSYNQETWTIENQNVRMCVAEITPRRVGDSIQFEVEVYVNDKTTTLSVPLPPQGVT